MGDGKKKCMKAVLLGHNKMKSLTLVWKTSS